MWTKLSNIAQYFPCDGRFFIEPSSVTIQNSSEHLCFQLWSEDTSYKRLLFKCTTTFREHTPPPPPPSSKHKMREFLLGEKSVHPVKQSFRDCSLQVSLKRRAGQDWHRFHTMPILTRAVLISEWIRYVGGDLRVWDQGTIDAEASDFTAVEVQDVGREEGTQLSCTLIFTWDTCKKACSSRLGLYSHCRCY